jgi:hypothetical protein
VTAIAATAKRPEVMNSALRRIALIWITLTILCGRRVENVWITA